MSDPRAQGFLQNIVTEPDDDTPRLIYADWLDEQGGSDRAEFIRVQVERASLPKWDARQVRLGLREQELLARHGEEWKAELPAIKGVEWGKFRRGFVATAAFASLAPLRRPAACWAAAPIEAVTIRWPRRQEKCESIPPIAGLRELSIRGNVLNRDEVVRLAEAPLLSTLRVLAIPAANLMTEELHRLTASPHLGNLKALRLPCNFIGNAAVRALFDAASLDSLEELDLSEQGSYREDMILESTGVEALVGWPGMARIRSLNLSGNSVGQRGLRALLRSPHTVGLKELVLRDNGLLGQALQEFEKARPQLRLDILDLGENPLDESGVAYLAKAKCLAELKVLQLNQCELPPSAAGRLAGARFLASLRQLSVRYNSFRREGLQALVEAEPQSLHTLCLANNNLGDDGVAPLAASAALDALLELNLNATGLGATAVRALAKTKHLRNLLILRLIGNRIDAAVADALRESPLGQRLAILELPKRAPTSGDEDIAF